MAQKTMKRRKAVVLIVLFLIIGFVIGEFVPLPFLQNVTITAAMTRPGDRHHRR